MSFVVPIIIVVILIFQIYFFVMNVHRMKEYKEIFENSESWEIEHNPETGFVSGISGRGNHVFTSTKDSINKYLSSNSGSVIDFHLLKDAVDRHCDAVENDVNTLTPVPLYCGLAGTMLGVILGLASLLTTGSVTDLLNSGSGNFGAAAIGVSDLLEGVAFAMVASIFGIAFTTTGSILFKSYKLEGEAGKNTFLAWLQARLLPELPSDTSEALSSLVKNLNKFNNTFAVNTSNLGDALKNVNESYRIQANIIQSVHDMDVMKMAKANVNVLRELKDCTDKLELFNQYLNDIEGYTDAIHTFTTQFEVEANRLHVLEEIQQFFTRHKEEIVKDSADIDVALHEALTQLKESTGSNISELNSIFVRQAEEFKEILQEEKDSFERVNKEISAQFNAQLSMLPMLESKLSEVSTIPSKIDSMIERLEHSNSMLYSNFVMSMAETIKKFSTSMKENGNVTVSSNGEVKPKSNWIIVLCAILIAIACISNTVYTIWFSEKADSPQIEKKYEISSPIEQLDGQQQISQEGDNVQEFPQKQKNEQMRQQKIPENEMAEPVTQDTEQKKIE